MKVCLYAGVLAVVLLGVSVVRGQAPNYPAANAGVPATAGPTGQPLPLPMPGYNGNGPPIASSPGLTPGAPTPGGQPGGGAATSPGVNDYLTYLRPTGCCGPLGRHGPINTEMFLRTGMSFPIGGSILGRALDPGFMIQGGARALFFTPRQDLAWTIELGITSAWYDAGRDIAAPLRNIQRPILVDQTGPNDQQATATDGTPLIETVAELPLTTSSVNQTSVHASIGHELYLLGLSDCSDPGVKWRVGYDLGGRWGSGKLIFKETLANIPLSQEAINNARAANQNLLFATLIPGAFPFRHRNDVVGGIFVALHTDLEVPCGTCILYAGVRTEFSYVAGDFLQPQNNTDLTTINVLFNLGCRF